MTEPVVFKPFARSALRRECGTCSAFAPNRQANPKAGQGRPGWCVANPPQLIVSAMPAGPLNPGTMVPVHQGAWPPTESNKFCRAWSPGDEISDDDASA